MSEAHSTAHPAITTTPAIVPRLACLLVLVGGCLDDETRPDELASTEQGLIGATTTTARPEIGRIDGAHCTATLIAPQLALTSALCVFNRSDGWFVVGPASFSYRYTVARTWSTSLEANGVYDDNLALLHLATPVPSNVATPATISLNLPATGEPATTFGFGCSSVDGTDAGRKRYLGFPVESFLQALCTGDEGGPVVLGDLADNGSVYAVNSTRSLSWWSGDLFADVATHKLQIEDLLHLWDGNLEQGFDRVGAALGTPLALPSAFACAQECKSNAICHTFAYGNGTCWLSRDTPDFFSHPGFVSGVAPMIEAATDRGGSDYTNFVPSPALPEVCIQACQNDSRCHAWSFNFAANGNPARCWLKSAVPAATASTLAVSGVANRLIEFGFDRPGGEYAHVTGVTSAADCATRCAKDRTCRAFSWGASNTCSLKNTVPNAVAALYSTSGVKRGLEVDVDRPGPNIASYDIADPSPFACQAKCASNTSCKAWTYVRPVSGSNLYTCYLKSAIAPGTYSPGAGLISGIQGLEFMMAPTH